MRSIVTTNKIQWYEDISREDDKIVPEHVESMSKWKNVHNNRCVHVLCVCLCVWLKHTVTNIINDIADEVPSWPL